MRLATGSVRLSSEITEESAQFDFAVLHLGEHNITAGVRLHDPAANGEIREKLFDAFTRGRYDGSNPRFGPTLRQQYIFAAAVVFAMSREDHESDFERVHNIGCRGISNHLREPGSPHSFSPRPVDSRAAGAHVGR